MRSAGVGITPISTAMARILTYSSPATGHVLPLVPGLRELAARGHDVHLRVDAASIDLVRGAGLEASAQDPRIAAIRITDHEAEQGIERLRRGLRDLITRGGLERVDLLAAIDEVQPDVLIVDTNAYGALTLAEASGLPWAMSFPSLVPFKERGIPTYGLGLRPMRGPVGRLRDAVLWRVIEAKYAEAMLPGLNALRAESSLPPLRSPLELYDAPGRILALTGPPLEYPRVSPPASLRFVGAQRWDPPAETPGWVTEPGDPWVLVTCSTEYQGDEALAAAAIEGLRDEPVRVLVTAADAADASSLPVAPNARVERFVPHGAVLPHVAAVVCHGGMGITQKAIAAGVPLLVVPFGRDQPEVARRVVEAGAGVRLPQRKLTPERLRTGVRDAMLLRDGAREAGAVLRASGGGAAFADAVAELIPMAAGAVGASPAAGIDLRTPAEIASEAAREAVRVAAEDRTKVIA